MKQRDLIYAILAALIFVIVGYIGYTQLFSHHASAAQTQTTVDVVTPLDPTLDQTTISEITNIAQTKDFVIQLNIATGLGNATPFGG